MSSENRYTVYDHWAWLYNQSEAHLACQRLLPSLEKLLLPQLPEAAEILDLCCGTGQLAQQLIARGYQVTGLDSSEKMLHYARENAPNVQFILGDARSFKFPSTFDAVICTDSSLNHIMSLEELKRVFRNVYAALKENGLLLFDLGLENRYRNIPITDGELKAEYGWTVGETYNLEKKTGTFIITIFRQANDKSNKKLTKFNLVIRGLKRLIYNNFLRYARPSTLLQLIEKDWQSSEIVFPVRSYSNTEVQLALEEAGFTSVNVYNLRGLAVSKEDNEVYFVARKPYHSPSSTQSLVHPIQLNN